MDEDTLFEEALERIHELAKYGTGAIEIKSGYGLSVEGELKMLRVIKRLKAASPMAIKATFLGAHAFPVEFKENHQGYIDLIINEMLPKIAADRKSTRLNSSHVRISYAVFCLKKKKIHK